MAVQLYISRLCTVQFRPDGDRKGNAASNDCRNRDAAEFDGPGYTEVLPTDRLATVAQTSAKERHLRYQAELGRDCPQIWLARLVVGNNYIIVSIYDSGHEDCSGYYAIYRPIYAQVTIGGLSDIYFSRPVCDTGPVVYRCPAGGWWGLLGIRSCGCIPTERSCG